MGRRRSRRTAQGRRAVGSVLALAVIAVVLSSCASPRAASGPSVSHTHPLALQPTTTTTRPDPLQGVTLDATTKGSIPGSPSPGAPADQTVPGEWYGYPSVLPVVAQRPGWYEVRLAQRPNESIAWVQAGEVSLSLDPYRLVLNLTTMHLTVFEDGRVLFDFPAGIGTSTDPTVTGHYFITMRYPPPSAAYGPFVLVTSAHSDAITDWEGSGDAVIAIHGPIDSYADSLIGTTGAAVSHGCIRLHDADLAKLTMITAGTPLDIVQ